MEGKNMRVLFDYQIFVQQEYGGVSRYYIELKKELEKYRDFKIDIKVLFPRNVYLRQEQNKRIYALKNQYLRLGIEIVNKIFNMILCLVNRYDIVHITWNSRYLNRLCKKKLIVTIHDMIHELYMKEDKVEIRNKRRAIEDATLILAVSNSTKRDILKIYPYIDEKKIRIIYHGTNHLPIAEAPVGIEIPEKYLLYVGKKEGYKNGLFFINCIDDLLALKNDLYFIFIGGGDWNEEERAVINKYSDRVIQMQVSDAELAYMYQNALAFVYPSLYEGFGLPILEAYDNNCPVVCSNTSSLPEVGGDAALYFDPTDKKEMIAQIMKVINDPFLKKEMIKKGLERTKIFAWENTAKEIYAAYKSVADR